MPDRERHALLVPGGPATGTHQVRAPFDGALLGEVETGGRPAVDVALDTAARLHADRDGWLPAEQRLAVLERTAAILGQRREELALGAAREGGKPLVDSLVEVDRAIDGIKLCGEALRSSHGTEVPMGLDRASAGRLAWTRKEPVGPVLAFSAFNHPLNLIVHQVGPAVAAGCPVVVKPAEATPLSCLRFVGILREAGLPEAWCQALLVEDLDIAGAMAADPRVAFFSFIGSAEVGWMLRGKLAPGTRCALEHGGVAPILVARDADLDDALPLLAKGGFYHAGQVCVSVQRIYADRRIARELADRLGDVASRLVVGDPTHPDTQVGPLIRTGEVERVDAWVREAIDAGAELVTGGRALSERTYAPTVLLDPPDDVRVSTREVFGPVVSVYGFEELDDAIARANALPYAFQAGVFTRDLDTALRAARRLDASAVMVNDHSAFRVDWMPFAGLRHSGLGVGGIGHTLDELQIDKLTVVRSREL